MTHITKIACVSGICAAYYYVSHYNRISLQNKYLTKLLGFVQKNKPGYAIGFFKMLLKINLIEKDSRFNEFVLKDFDSEGRYIQEVKDLGFKGLQIGPVSFNTSAQDEQEYHLGVKHTFSQICGYRNLKKTTDFQIYLNLVPNLEILKFAPYLLKQNIMQSIQFFSQIQKVSNQTKLLDGIVVDFDRKTFALQKSLESEKLKEELKNEANSLIQQLNKTVKHQIKLSFQKRPYKQMKWQDLLSSILKDEVAV